jgi:hypothetical protein
MVNVRVATLDPYYLLGILNSSLLQKYWLEKFYDQRRTFPKIKGTYLKQLPIHLPTPSNAESDRTVQKLISLVKMMIALHSELNACKSGQQKAALERQIRSSNEEIDSLVYQLYGLAAHEIALVAAVDDIETNSTESDGGPN